MIVISVTILSSGSRNNVLSLILRYTSETRGECLWQSPACKTDWQKWQSMNCHQVVQWRTMDWLKDTYGNCWQADLLSEVTLISDWTTCKLYFTMMYLYVFLLISFFFWWLQSVVCYLYRNVVLFCFWVFFYWGRGGIVFYNVLSFQVLFLYVGDWGDGITTSTWLWFLFFLI